MKILITTGIYPPDIGGPATYSKLLNDELPKRGFQTEVLSFGLVRHLPKIIRHFVYFWKILKVGKSADIIFAQDPVSVGLPSVFAAKILRKKFILKIVGDYAWEQYCQRSNASLEFSISNFQFPNPEEFQIKKFDLITELRRRIQKFVAKKAEKIIVPSEYLKKIVSLWGVNREKIKVIYNAFDAPEIVISKEEARKKLNLSGFVLISAGRLVPWKGFSALIEIMPELAKEIAGLKLIIIGDGPEQKNLKSQISNLPDGKAGLKINESVFMVGQIPHEDLLMYLQAGDIFALNTGYEGFSHQLLEAMAFQIPIVTTAVGGNLELIKNRESGILVEYNDKNGLKNAILALYNDGDLRSKIIANAEARIAEFNKDKMIQTTIEIL